MLKNENNKNIEKSKIEESKSEIDLDNIDTDKVLNDTNLYRKPDEEINLGDSVSEDVQDEVESKEKKKKNSGNSKKNDNYKYILYLFLILLITGLVLWFNLTGKTTDASGNEIFVYQTIGEVFSNIDWGYFAVFVSFIILSFLVSSLIIFLFARLYTRHYKYHQAVANNSIGAFYSAITPGASGGQFAQIYTFKKQGMPVSNSASIFVMSFIIYQSSLIIIGLVSLITRFDLILGIDSIPITLGDISFSLPIWIFILFGFLLNLTVIFLLLFMSYSQHFLHFVSVTLIRRLSKLRIIKHPEEKTKSIRIQVENYRIELRRLQSNIPFTILIFILTFINLIICQLSPFFSGLALNAFNLSDINVPLKMYDCLVSLSFHQMISGLIPLPGSAGISEIVFGILFGPSSEYFSQEFYSKGGLNILLLVWRFGTFYIPFIVNGIIAATYKTRGLPLKDRVIPVGDRKTMLTIQLETYTERKKSSDTIFETKALERKELLSKLNIKEALKHKEEVKKESLSTKTIEVDKKEDTIIIGDDDEHSDIL